MGIWRGSIVCELPNELVDSLLGVTNVGGGKCRYKLSPSGRPGLGNHRNIVELVTPSNDIATHKYLARLCETCEQVRKRKPRTYSVRSWMGENVARMWRL